MNIKTITTVDGVNAVDFGSGANRYYWFRNLGTTTVYVSGNADISAGADGVAALSAGDSACIETLGGKVYILGEGTVEIHNTGDKFRPFKQAPAQSGGGSAADAYTKTESDARYAQKSDIPAISDPNIIINPDFRINQRGSGTYSGSGGYCVDRWYRNTEVTVTVGSDGLTFSYSGTSNPSVYQRLEDHQLFLGKTITFSACINGTVYSCTGTIPSTIESSVQFIAFARLDGEISVPDNTTPHIRIQLLTTGVIFVLNGIDKCEWTKAEIGDIPTAFTPPNSADEQLKCQRYFLSLNPSVRYPMVRYNANDIDFILPINSPFRAKPTITGDLRVRRADNDTTQTGFTFTVTGTSANAIAVRASKTNHGLTGGCLEVANECFLNADIY